MQSHRSHHISHSNPSDIQETHHFQSGWYALQVQNGPIQYAHTPHLLIPFKSCLNKDSPIHEGDFIILHSLDPCLIEMTRLSGKILLDLGLPLDLNQSLPKELVLISGIGLKRAKMIARYRPFKTIRQLRRIKGIGRKTLKKLKPFLTLKPPRSLGPF